MVCMGYGVKPGNLVCWFGPAWSQQILGINLHTYFTYVYEAWLFKYLFFQIDLSTCEKCKRSFSLPEQKI